MLMPASPEEWRRLCETEHDLQLAYARALRSAGGREGQTEPTVQEAEERWSAHQERMRLYLRGNPEAASSL
jgi:hypothetical protein